MEDASLAGIRIHVHASGDTSLDGILRLIELSSEALSLADKLPPMCAQVSRIAGVEVVSAYVRERGPDGDVLIMRGNVGFPAGSVQTARLRLGEGITGFVAECLRPVSAGIAADDSHFVPIPGLGEEQYPSFLGVPLIHAGASVGVLVLQRKGTDAFDAKEVTLATALAAPFAAAIDLERRRASGSPAGRSVRLRGLPMVAGAAIGRSIMLPTLSSLVADTTPGTAVVHPSPAVAATGALDSLQRDFDRAQKRLRHSDCSDVQRALANLRVILSDRRFRERLEHEVNERGLIRGLERITREYARVPYLVGASHNDLQSVLAERSREVEDLCVLIWARARDHRFLEQGAVLISSRMGIFATLAAVARGVKAVVIEDHVPRDTPALEIAAAAGMPVVAEVSGLFAWARNRDMIVVDGSGGTVEINPSAATLARYKRDTSG